MLKKNLSELDRAVRLFAGVVLIMIYAVGAYIGPINVIILLGGAFFIATSLLGFCPIHFAITEITALVSSVRTPARKPEPESGAAKTEPAKDKASEMKKRGERKL